MDIKKLHLKINRLVDSLFVGNYKTAFKGRGIEFADYRVYDEGDDARFIDFLASFKEQKLLIKRFEEQRELSVYFLIDIGTSMQFGYKDTKKIDTLIETFYTISLAGIKSNDMIGRLLFNDNSLKFIKPKKGIKHILNIISKIKNNNLKKIDNFDINDSLKYFNNLPIKNSLVFLLTDKVDNFLDKNLKILGIKNDVVYINIFDYFENNLDDNYGIVRLKSIFKTFFINLNDTKKVLEYRKLRELKIKNFQKKLKSFNLSYLMIDDSMKILSKLLYFFKTR
ncbi:DUF58 domain-containing protein [Candidatus Gracilibacteria bacterium]|nr:DUF58 domain-containing protein [Candidatus Gracilibacteria bacterium]